MKLIEDYWLDGVLYYVEFLVEDGRIIKKKLILPQGIEKKKLEKIILKRFNNIKRIKTLDFISEVLLINDINNQEKICNE